MITVPFSPNDGSDLYFLQEIQHCLEMISDSLTANLRPVVADGPVGKWCLLCTVVCSGSNTAFYRLSALLADGWEPGPHLNIKTVFPRYGIPMLKIRWSRDRLIFNMGIPILVRRHLYIETPPALRSSKFHTNVVWNLSRKTTSPNGLKCEMNSNLLGQDLLIFACTIV